jgi:hypothetical protein
MKTCIKRQPQSIMRAAFFSIYLTLNSDVLDLDAA